MHLQTVLVLIHRLRHPVEVASLVQGSCGLAVDSQVAKWCSVARAARESSLCEVEVVRRSEKEDSFA